LLIGAGIFYAITLALTLRIFAVDLVIAEGESMLPSIQPRAVLVMNKAAYGMRTSDGVYVHRWSNPKLGEIVVFYTPEGTIAVKRCVAIEGDLFYAQGDNLLQSYDSRHYGVVPKDNIIGRIVGVK